MGRKKGSLNKKTTKAMELELDTQTRIKLLADLLVDIAVREKSNAA